MISNKASLITRLGWVIKDIESLVEKARQSLDQYIRDKNARHSEDETRHALQECQDCMEHVHGSLDIVGADGAAMLAREINLLVSALYRDEIDRVEEAKETLVDAFLRLPEYLNHLKEGYADLPVIILPLLNDLRALRDEELLSEHLVFLPENDVVNNDDIGTDEYIPLEDSKLKEACVRLRYHFQKSLLGWYKDDNKQAGLQTLQRVSRNLIRMNERMRLRSLWWIVTGLAEALENNKLDSSVTVKLLMGRMEREIRLLGEHAEEGHDQIVPDELIKNLLYYVGLAEKGSETLDAVKSAYLLDLHLPQGETLEELREFYSSPGRELWKSVADSLQENITQVIKGFENIDSEEAAKPQFEPLIDNMQKVTGTLNVIGLSRAASIVEGMITEVTDKSNKNQHPEQESNLAIAENLLKLQTILKEYAETGDDITDSVFDDASRLDTETVQQTQNAMIEELQASQGAIIEFVDSEAAFFQLEQAIEHLGNIKGGLVFLGYGDCIPMHDALVTYLKEDLHDKKRQPEKQEADYLADTITSLETVIKTMQQNEDYTSILSNGYDSLMQLSQSSGKHPLLNEQQLEEIEQQLQQKKKTFQKLPPSIIKKMKTL